MDLGTLEIIFEHVHFFLATQEAMELSYELNMFKILRYEVLR